VLSRDAGVFDNDTQSVSGPARFEK